MWPLRGALIGSPGQSTERCPLTNGSRAQIRPAPRVEGLAERLASAEFTTEDTVRLLAQITNMCGAYARDVIFNRRGGDQVRPHLLRQGLAQTNPGRDPLLTPTSVAGPPSGTTPPCS